MVATEQGCDPAGEFLAIVPAQGLVADPGENPKARRSEGGAALGRVERLASISRVHSTSTSGLALPR